jgi:DNA-binding XRE family transcriptional regulator
MERYLIDEDSNDDRMSIGDVFSSLTQKTGEAGVLLRGLRFREGLSQIQFAQKLGITQTNLSAMENGRRTIGKELAKRIGDIFEIDYRLFL